MRQKGVLYFREIPRALKDQFKGQCAVRGETMQDVVEAAMRLFLRDPKQFEVELQKIKGRRHSA